MRNYKNLRIAVAGTGYVGLSIATLLAQYHEVIAVDVIPEKVEKINQRISPIQDEYIEKFFAEKELNLTATLDGTAAYKDADIVVIAAPTNYDPVKNFFDTHHIEDVIDLVLSVNPDAVMIIKSTIPVGYTRSLYVKYANQFLNKPELKGKKFNLLFSPEFLRESKALYDNLYPSRIIVGYPKIIEQFDEENQAIKAIAGENLGTCLFHRAGADFFQCITHMSSLVTLLIYLAALADFYFQPVGEGIYNRRTYTVQTTGYLVSPTAEFTAISGSGIPLNVLFFTIE